MGKGGIFVLAGVFLIALLTESASGVAVMSVDIGSEWLKVAIVSPGVPMEIALNKESKRKTPTTITFRGAERTFGEDAQVAGQKFPQGSFSYFLDLLGKPPDHPIVKLHAERFPQYSIEADAERGTLAFRVDENTTFAPEELLAQTLQKSREFAENSAGQKIDEAVLVVPAFFNQAERRAVLRAAELADLRVLQLFNDNTAVALNYGIFRRREINDTTQYVMFYDMGASSTIATIVGYRNVKSKDKGPSEVTPQVSVLGVGYDRTLGGLEFQIRLRNYLAEEFDKMAKTRTSAFASPRAMAKLFKEAGRVKNILSANSDHYAEIEGLLEERDFKLRVTREKLEELCADLFERVAHPIKMALETSALSMDLISQVVLVGAGTRMPKVQDKLRDAARTTLAKNINTDEAAVLGAVYKAADLSQGFKVKKFITKDTVVFPVQVVFDRNVDGKTKQVRKTLFGKMNAYPQKKIITFNKHKDDFEFTVQYAELDHLPKREQSALGNLTLSHVRLTGVADAYEKHSQQNADSKGIRAHFTMDDSGILNLHNVELISEKTVQAGPDEEEASDDSEAAEKIESNSKDEIKPTTSEDSSENSSPGGNEADRASAQNQTKINGEKVAANRTEKAPKKPTITTIRDKINAMEIRYGPQGLQGDKFQQSRDKIRALDHRDTERSRRETAQNNLESYLIDAKQKMDSSDHAAAATAEEIEIITRTCDELLDWLYEDGFDAGAEVYEEKLKSVKKITKGVYERVFEHHERPDALRAMISMINGSTTFLNNMKELAKAQEIFNNVEMESLEKIINETQNYHDEIAAWFKDAPLSEPIKYRVRDIANKMAELDREVKYLVNKAKIWKPKAEKLATNETKATSTDESPEVVEPVSRSGDEADEAEPEIATTNASDEPRNETQIPAAEQSSSGARTKTSERDEAETDSSHEEL